jgi:putative peptidoglycan lipid II flippase
MSPRGRHAGPAEAERGRPRGGGRRARRQPWASDRPAAQPPPVRPGGYRRDGDDGRLYGTQVPAPPLRPDDYGPITGEQPAIVAPSLVRSSGVMALGTLVSRITGFLRTAVLIYALGTHDLGNAYNLANTVPNAVYNLALGGILTSVVVPLLVNAAKRHRDRGEAYDQRIFTLGVLALGVVTLVATLAAQPITALYGHGIGSGDPAARAAAYHLTVIFAYFFIPQIFFYGVSSLAGAILNARGSFAAPMWTPVINNLVVIVMLLGYIAVAGFGRTPTTISAGEVQLLGLGTTIGIVAQTVAMLPSLRQVGFRWQPRFDFRRREVNEIGRMGGWMFGYVLTTQVAFLVTAIIANTAGARVSAHDAGAGFAAYSNAWQLFQLPYAIVGISVITAMLPRMSAHAAEGSYRRVRDDFSVATRLASVIVVPAALVLAVLGPPLAEGVFGYGSTSAASARYLGEVFAVFSLGLLPYMLFQLLLRVFYAMHDSRTPALIGVVTMITNIAANLIALAVLPPAHVVAGLGAGFALANLIGTVAAWRVISRRIGGLDGRRITRSLVRMHVSAIPGMIFAESMAITVAVIAPGGRLGALVTVTLAGAGALFMYVLFAKALNVSELDELTGIVRTRFRPAGSPWR